MKLPDLTGQVFGRLTVVGLSDRRDKSGARVWECLCECGNTAYVTTSRLIKGKRKSCGCGRTGPRDYYVRKTVRYQPMKDCFAYEEQESGGCYCIALNEMLCVSKGRCAFYKHK